MRKVLFITYDFPPCRNIGGSLRSAMMAHYLERFGWRADVVAMEETPGAHGTPGRRDDGVTRLPSLTPWHHPYHMTPWGWSLNVARRAEELLASVGHQVIYVSAPPFGPALAGLRLQRLGGLPLVVDFRDAWSLDPYVEGSRLKKVLNRHLFPALERRMVARCDALLVNTPSTLRGYLERYPRLAGRIHLLNNGFDEEDFFNYSITADDRVDDGRLTLLYTGRFGVADRRPRELLRALRRFPGVRLKVLGDDSPWLMELATECGTAQQLELHPPVPHREAVTAMAHCDALLLYQQRSDATTTPIAGKTFEYLRAGKPILALAPAGDNLRLVTKFARHHAVAASDDEAAICRAIAALADLKHKGRLPQFTPPPTNYRRSYSRERLAEKLADHLNRLSTRGRG